MFTRQELKKIFNGNTIGISEDVNGNFYTIYNREAIIQAILKLQNDELRTNKIIT